jgi:alpha-amylase
VLTITTDKAAGYHGYWAEDLYAINSNYGTAADLKSLVSTAHAKVRTSHATSILHIH